MDLGLSGRNALVLGASRGLGYAIAEALAREGCNVLVAARTADDLAKAAARLGEAGRGRVAQCACDLSGRNAAAELHAALERELGGADILVNNGGGPPPGPITDVTRETWDAQFQAMVASLFELTGRVLPGMRQRGWGRILTVVSSGVVQPIDNLGISNALRSSIVGWSKTLANEVGPDGVTVNCIAPGRIATDRTAGLDRKAAERQGLEVAEVERRSRAMIPLRRYGDPGEFGATAAFLASQAGAYITGSVIRVDGGLVKSV